MVYDIHSEDYFSVESLENEMERIYDICHGCRLCFNLCPSFPSLFDAIDRHEEKSEGEVEALTKEEIYEVVDLCYNCKLCYPKCPFIPPHKFKLDFPRLMLRAKAIEAKKNGIPLQDRVLGRPDIIGKLGSFSPKIANTVNKTKAGRILIEKTVGLHRDFNLPQFSYQPFSDWFLEESKKHIPPEKPCAKVALFSTCTVNYNTTSTGKSLTKILWHNNIKVVLPKQVCCGMPLLDGGDIEGCTDLAQKNIDAFIPWIEEGYDIIIPGPTCSYMFKDDYQNLIPTEKTKKIALHTFDASEFLMKLQNDNLLKNDFKRGPGRIAYQLPCHLKVQNIGLKSAEMLRLIPDTDVEVVEKCSAVDGTWGMKKEYFDLSQKYAQKLYRGLKSKDADVYASDCPLSRQNIIYGTGKPAYHPVELLCKAYGLKL